MPNQTNPPTQKTIANYIGSIAQQSFTNEQIAMVMGHTSLGIFLKTAPKWVVFLSYEDFRGPLTVNLGGNVSLLRELPTRGMLHISRDRISGPGAGVSIELEDALPWMPPPPPQPLNGGERRERLLTFLQQAYTQAGGVGLSTLLPSLGEDSVYAGNHPQRDEFVNMQENLEGGNIFNLIQTLGNLLGRGRGLTPSWDDFTMGLLLTLNRWEHIIQPQFGLGKLNAEITKAAYAKTTTISANLIECATHGLADERLIAAVDYILAGTHTLTQVLTYLLGWGSSSGLDALVGMAVVILSL